ncbi:MAG: response regulator transcription factor [Rhodocyclales bacterium]|nr:response regulator transcription factor [Rhodocyclales bacterium]
MSSRRAGEATAIRVLLVDDHPALRAGLRSLLCAEPGMHVVADLASGEEANAWYRNHATDVVVMDLSMEGYGGMEAIRRLAQFDPRIGILVYSVHATEIVLSRALALGALGYVTKASSTEVLIAGVREVAARRGFVSPDLIPAMVQRQAAPEQSRLSLLGDREFQILLLTAQGHTVEHSARTLNLSEKTVRNHLTRIKAKLGVANTAELTRLAIRAGLASA